MNPVLQTALAAHQAGRLDEAAHGYRAILATRPNDATTWYLLGTLACQQGDPQTGVAHLDRSLQLNPRQPQALNNRGVALKDLERLDEALASYDAALKLSPAHAEAHNNRGVVLKLQNDLHGALAAFERAITHRADYPEAHINAGNTFKALGRLDEALAAYDRGLVLTPLRAENHFARANVLNDLRRFFEAIEAFETALRLRPNYPEALNNLGTVRLALLQYAAAQTLFEQALALRPDYLEALNNLGRTLICQHQPAAGLACIERAVRERPSVPEWWINLAGAYQEAERFEEAHQTYLRILADTPDQEAVRGNLALLQLLQGDFENGLPGYEARWLFPSPPKGRLPNRQLWLGQESIAGRRLLVTAEQGLGDFIQYCRYIPQLAKQGTTVIVQAPSALQGLLKTLDGVSDWFQAGEPEPDFDLHCPIMSLPLACGTTLESIPADIPYLRADPDAIARWSARLGPKTRPQIGLVWSGNAQHPHDYKRSIPLAQLAPLFDLPPDLSVEWHALQNEFRPGDVAKAQDFGIHLHATELHDFVDTAALCSQMDCVIAVDTSVAHLAGALGLPLWIPLPPVPDFRWLLYRNDSPWYPTARLFRQTSCGDWGAVVTAMRQALSETLR